MMFAAAITSQQVHMRLLLLLLVLTSLQTCPLTLHTLSVWTAT